jgi:hypothetical protein
VGEEMHVSGGVFDHGTYEEDGPVTWEILCLQIDVINRPLLVRFFSIINGHRLTMEENAHADHSAP